MRNKTWKREVAIVQLVLHWLLVMLIAYIAFNEAQANIDALVTLATGLAVWVYGFAGAAFGMDAWAKQVRALDQLNEQY
jgi:hypothetical protein